MAIYGILYEVKDIRETDTGVYEFNSFLEDYLSIIETAEGKEDDCTILSRLLEKDHNLKTCANLRLSINKSAITNQIIRYKDSFELLKGTIKCPHIIYRNFDEYQKAVILMLRDKEEYTMTEVLYHVMSEPENEYEGTWNEIIVLSVDKESVGTLLDTVESFLERNCKAGIVQRELDTELFLNYNEMYELAQKIVSYQLVNLRDILAKCGDKEECINNIIANWFPLRRFSYVQYMMNKNNLDRVHEGNVKKQRQVAKEKCDTIGFVSYSELWKLVGELR